MLYLALCVPVDIVAISSRLGTMPSINTVKALLKGFSDQKAIAIRTRGRDTSVERINNRVMTKAILLIFDNVQHFMKQRDFRIGRENSMIIGIAATYVELNVQAASLDVVDKRKRIAQNLRMEVTVDKLLGLIDQDHMRKIGRLQWIEALTRNIPQLAVYKAEVSLRYRTSVAKLRVPVKKSEIHPLATSGKNEALIGDLKDGLLDFLEQLGHSDGDYDFRLLFGGGDGMSYNNMLILKKYLQTDPDTFRRFELLRPVLQVWHTQWTNLTRVLQTHMGDFLSNNPATIRWAAKKIGRNISGEKKSDFYPDSQLLALLHDTQMLDAWRCVGPCVQRPN